MIRKYETNAASLAALQRHFPDQRPPTLAKDRIFELSIACAGGTSTGAYIAGVLDFLWEALDCWAAEPGPKPDHTVRINHLVGTSAGGLTVAVAALMGARAFDPARHSDTPAQRAQNPLYNAWVEQITLTKLLSHPEQAETGEVALFYAAPRDVRTEVFTQIANAQPKARAWLAHPLDLRLVIGDLRGVPYALDFNNTAHGQGADQVLFMHRDHVAFSLQVRPDAVDPAAHAPDAHELDPATFAVDPPAGSPWRLFGEAAVASAAIPLVFATVDVAQNPWAYDWRTAWFDSARGVPVVDVPVWEPPLATPPADFVFTATDGGVFDDAPFDLARRRLAGQRGRNPQAADEARRAVILVDPILDEGAATPSGGSHTPNEVKKGPLDLILRLVFSPVEQSRLSTFDLAMIKDEDIRSRYMIAPSRKNPDNPNRAWGPALSLMTRPMNAVMGFAHHAYREHDFLLGRYNAQWFLRRHFSLPATNSIVKGHTAKWRADEKTPDGEYPVIPLRGSAAVEIPPPVWNWQALKDKSSATEAGVDEYGRLLKKRLDGIFKNLKQRASGDDGPLKGLGGWLFKTLFGLFVWPTLRGKIVDAFEDGLKKARDDMNPAADHRR